MNILERFYLKKQAQTALTLFHGTDGASGKEILETGLLRPRELTDKPSIDKDLPSREDCVYVTPDYDIALDRAGASFYSREDGGEDSYIFTVNATPEELYLDEDSVWEYIKSASEDMNMKEYLTDYLASKDIYGTNKLLSAFLGTYPTINYIAYNEDIKNLTEWIEENDPVMKAAIILRSSTNSYCLKKEVPIVDYEVLNHESEEWE